MKLTTEFKVGGGNLEEPGTYTFMVKDGFDKTHDEYGRQVSILVQVQEGDHEGETMFDPMGMKPHPESKTGVPKGIMKLCAMATVCGVLPDKDFSNADEMNAFYKAQLKELTPDKFRSLVDKLKGCMFVGEVGKRGKSSFEIKSYTPLNSKPAEEPKAVTQSW